MRPNILLTLLILFLTNLAFAQTGVKEQLDSIYINDQIYRLQLDSVHEIYGRDSQEYQKLKEFIEINDSENLAKVIAIFDTYGWLGADIVGENGNNALFLVIQHSDLKTQEKYKPLMEEAVKKGNASASSFALLTDRIEMGKGNPQIYGSQVQGNRTNGYKLYPVADEKNVNKRRAGVGLPPLEEYLKQWDIEYTLPDE